jgi:hypothetical protein
VTEDPVRDEIAFIRSAIEAGRGYAGARSPDMLVWGIAVAAGYLGTYATVRGWWRLDQSWLWAVCIVLPWIYSLRCTLRRFVPGQAATEPQRPATARAMQMLWLGCGICLTSLAAGLMITGEINRGWFGAVTAGILGIAFFASSFLCNLAWMRWVAVVWWLGELGLLFLERRPEMLPVSALMMLGLLALPGFVLLRRRTVGS